MRIGQPPMTRSPLSQYNGLIISNQFNESLGMNQELPPLLCALLVS